MIARISLTVIIRVAFSLVLVASTGRADERDDFFEAKIRPLLIERCHKCHSNRTAKGGLRLDSRAAAVRGGESGPAVVDGKPNDSLLIQAVRHENGLAMPPDGKLSASQIADLTKWVTHGAAWPGNVRPTTEPNEVAVEAASTAIPPSTPPNAGELAKALQLWLRADALTLADGEAVPVWPDQSGHGRDVTATKGVRRDGVGLPGKFVQQSSLRKRPAVRFDTSTGFASSPDRPVDISGDASLTIVLVMNLEMHDAQPPYDGVVGLGDPANPGCDPGRPLAALVQINRGEDHALHFAGGWNHDASLGAGSFKRHYGQSLILSITKAPGPMRTTTRIFLDGERSGVNGSSTLEGRDTVPAIRHRSDIGVYLGKAVSWAGSIRGE